jgi:hypothetical protein
VARGDKWNATGKWRLFPLVGYPAFGVLVAPDGEPRPVACITPEEARRLAAKAREERLAADREARGGEGGAYAADRLGSDVRTHRGERF